MVSLDFVKTKEEIFDFLEEYSFDKKNEIDKRQLGQGTGLIKTYMLETEKEFTANTEVLAPVFQDSELRLTRLNGDPSISLIKHKSEDFGFLEILSSRHLAIHTIHKTANADGVVRRTVRDTPQLDHVWLSGFYLNQLWETVVKSKPSYKSVKFRFHQNDYFDEGIWNDEDSDGEVEDGEVEDVQYNEGTGSTITYTDKIATISEKWDELRRLLPAFRSINMLRIPADEIRGGYDFWNEGKVTHRSPSFIDGREQVKWMVEDYQRLTEIIEERVWLQTVEIETSNSNSATSLKGTPVTFLFPRPLEAHILSNFIDQVFNQSNKHFRLWGKPIQVADNHYHVYGLDMHLWQRIYLDLSRERFMLILPKGTCGNTVHRLANNIQEFLSPEVETFIGNQRYEDLISQVITGQIN